MTLLSSLLYSHDYKEKKQHHRHRENSLYTQNLSGQKLDRSGFSEETQHKRPKTSANSTAPTKHVCVACADAVPSVQLNQASSNSGPGPQALQQSSGDPAVSKQELR